MKGLVFSGGGAKGSYEVGIVKALEKLKIDYDIVCGTSIGSVNSTLYVLGGYKLMKKFWYSSKIKDLFDIENINELAETDYQKAIQKEIRKVFAKAGVMFYPSALGQNEHTVGRTSLQFDTYIPIWKGCILALDAYGQFNASYDGEVPWQLREEICLDETRMRGYYQGCYTDNHQMTFQAELRQHLFWRIGAVAWGGTGIVFHEFDLIRKDMWLPNGGVGLRFELKHNTNARIDVGFGRNNMGVAFNFAEAF